MQLIEKKISGFDFISTNMDFKWDDYRIGKTRFIELEHIWNESGFDKNLYDSFIFLEKILDFNELTLLDIGSGKGQSIFNLALNFKFKKIIGIEIMNDYVNIFNKNFEIINESKIKLKTDLCKIENINIDAVDYDYKEEDIYFLFHPVGCKTLEKIFNKIFKIEKTIYIVYLNSVHCEVIEKNKNIKIIYKKNIIKFNNSKNSNRYNICKITIYKYN